MHLPAALVLALALAALGAAPLLPGPLGTAPALADDDGGGDDGGDDGDDGDDGGAGSSAGGASGGGGFDALIGALFGGEDHRAGEIAVYGLDRAGREALAAAGFRTISEHALPGIGGAVARLGVPPGLDAGEGLALAARLAPRALLDLNHVYATEGTGCTGEACWGARLVGLGPLSEGACRGGAPAAIVDTGVAIGHPALAPADITRRSFLPAGAIPASPEHGTAVAGLLVGALDAQGVPLAPGARLLVAEVFASEGGAPVADAVGILQGIDWAVASGARVIGLSLAGPANRIMETGIHAATARANVVAAAGNGGPGGDPAFPAAYPDVIAVAAVDARQRAYRSGTRGSYVDIAAPGVDVLSADAGGGLSAWSGSSFSVPFVMAALLRARAETRGDPERARRLLIESALDLGAPGHDEIYGWGLLSAEWARCR